MGAKIIKLIDTLVGKLLCWKIGYLDYQFNWTNKNPTLGNPSRFLVIRPGGMGDFIYLLPALDLLKKHYPAARIDVLAERRNRAAAGLSGAIDQLLLYDVHPVATLLRLLRNKYDVVIDTEQFHNLSAVFAYLTGSKFRVGFKTNPFRDHLYTHLIEYSQDSRESGEFMRLLAPLAIKPEEIGRSLFRERIKAQALPAGLDLSKPTVVIAPRGGDKYRNWAPEKFRRVIEFLLKDPKRQVVVVGEKAEGEFARTIAAPGERLIFLFGKTNFLELSRLLSESVLFFGNDSGVAVLANLLARKSVVLFGATNHRKWALEDADHLVVKSDLPCSPCYLLGSHKMCKKIDCMEKISAEEVIKAIEILYNKFN